MPSEVKAYRFRIEKEGSTVREGLVYGEGLKSPDTWTELPEKLGNAKQFEVEVVRTGAGNLFNIRVES